MKNYTLIIQEGAIRPAFANVVPDMREPSTVRITDGDLQTRTFHASVRAAGDTPLQESLDKVKEALLKRVEKHLERFTVLKEAVEALTVESIRGEI